MSQTVELAVTLSARRAEQGARQAENAFERVARRGREVVTGSRQIESSWGDLSRTATRLAGAIGIAFGTREVFRFARDSIEASREVEAVEAQLINTLERSGIAWEENRNRIQAHADALWDTHRITGGEVMGTLRQLIDMNGDYETSLRAVGVVSDTAAALQISNERAARYVARAIDGNASSFQRYNVSLDETGDILQQLEDRFGGAAAAGTTSAEALSRAMGDLREEIGTTFRLMGDEVTTADDMVEAIRDLTLWFRENGAEVGIWGSAIIGTLWDVVRISMEGDRLIRAALENAVANFVGTVLENINVVIRASESLRQQFDRIPGVNLDFRINEIPTERFWDMSRRSADTFRDSLGNIGEGLAGISGRWGNWDERIEEAAKKAAELRRQLDEAGEASGGGAEAEGDRVRLLTQAVELGVANVREQVELLATERELLQVMRDQTRSLTERVAAARAYQGVVSSIASMIQLDGLAGPTGPRTPGGAPRGQAEAIGPFASREAAEEARRALEGVEEQLGFIAQWGPEILATTDGLVSVADALGLIDGDSRAAARGLTDLVRGLQQMGSAQNLAGQIAGGLGIAGGVVGIGAGILGGLLGSGDRDRRREEERREQERLTREAERATESLRRFVDGLEEVSRWEGLSGNLTDNVRGAFLAAAAPMGGDAMMENLRRALDSEGLEAVLDRWRAAGPAFEELADRLARGQELIEQQRQAAIQSMGDQMTLQALRLQGLDAEATAMEEELRHKERLREARELDSQSLIDQAEALWELKLARRAEREAAEEARLVFEQRRDMLSLEAREAALAGDERTALQRRLQIGAEEEMRANQELVDAGERTEEWFERMARVINGEVNKELEEYDANLRRQAEAQADANRSFEQSTELMWLGIEGREEEVLAMERQIEFERRLKQAREDGIDPELIELWSDAWHAQTDKMIADLLSRDRGRRDEANVIGGQTSATRARFGTITDVNQAHATHYLSLIANFTRQTAENTRGGGGSAPGGHRWGGVVIQVYQQPGQDSAELSRQVAQRLDELLGGEAARSDRARGSTGVRR